MKRIHLFCLLALACPALSAYAQKYKTTEDTVKLNKEYVSVSNDLAELTAKLTIAQNDLPGYRSKSHDADKDASSSASASSDQASKATNGDLGDAKSEKKKANKAYKEAKDAKSASGKVSDQEEKIEQYKQDIKKKQQRLSELDTMRATIFSKTASDSLRQVKQ